MPDTEVWQGKSRGTPLGYRIFIRLLKTGGLKAAYGLLRFVAVYYRFFVPAATKPLRYLYEQRMGFDGKKASQLISRNVRLFGQTLIDKIVVLANLPNNLTFYHEGGDYLDQMVAEGNGGLLVSAHLGNWEVAGHLLQRLNTTVNILMYDGEGDQIRAVMEQFNSNRSFNMISIKDDLSHIYEISAALRRNEFVCLHADRFRPGNRTIEKEFLGEKAQFPLGPFLLASKLKAPVCFVFTFKETLSHYHFYAFPPKIYEGRGTTGAEVMADDYISLLEEKLRQYPEQWFNYFPFWQHESQQSHS